MLSKTDGQPVRWLPGFSLAIIAVLALSVAYFSSTLLPDLRHSLASLFPDDGDALPPLRIAIVGNFEGEGSQWDLPILNGALMLVDDINSSGGLAGRDLALEVFNDNDDPDRAAGIARDIARRDDIIGVIGHGASATSLPAAGIYREHQLPAMAPTATNPGLTVANDWYFRVIFSDELQGKVLAHYLRSVLGHESVAVVMNQSAYAQGLLRSFSATAGEVALNVGPEFTLAADTPENVLREIARRIGLMNELNAVLLIMEPGEAERFLPILRRVGTRADLIGTDSLSQIELSSGSDGGGGAPAYLDQVLLPLPFIPDTASRSARTFMEDYRLEHERATTWPALFGYDAALVLAEALRRVADALPVGDTPGIRQAVRDELASMGTPDAGVVGLSGPLYFNRAGDVIRPIYVGRVDHGRLTPAAEQLLIVDNPDMVTVLREEGENVIEVDGAMLQLTQVVKTGLQVDEISEIDTDTKQFAASFDIWFRYSGAFDPRAIVFPNAVAPVELAEPVTDRTWGNERYQLFRVQGRFGYQVEIDQLRRSQQYFDLRFRHSERDLSRLVYVPDLRAMCADSPRFSWAQSLRDRQVMDADSGWVIRDTAISQEVDSVSTLGDPLMPLVEIPFSAFQVSINAARAEVSLKRQIERLLPPANTWFVVITLLVLLALTAYPGFARHHPLATTVLRLVIVTLAVFYLEDALFSALQGRLEPFEMEMLLDGFRVIWWLIPAVWLIRLLPYLLWQPIQRHTGTAVPSIARLSVNLVILVLTSACIVAFVFQQPLTSLWAASGVLTLVLGFALQSLILDTFGGLMLSAERPFKIGDWIMVSNRNPYSPDPVGRVEEMNWRTTRLWTMDNNMVVIPNSAIAQAMVENFSAPSRPSRVQVPVVLGFEVAVERAVAVLGEGARRAVGEQGLLSQPAPSVVVERVEPGGIRYRVQGYHDFARVPVETATTAIIAALAAYFAELNMEFAVPGEDIPGLNTRLESPKPGLPTQDELRFGGQRS